MNPLSRDEQLSLLKRAGVSPDLVEEGSVEYFGDSRSGMITYRALARLDA